MAVPNTDLKRFASKRALATVARQPVVWDPGPNVAGRVAHLGSMQRTATGAMPGGSGGPSVVQAPARPFHPLFSSPDRLQLPVQLAQLNQYWRLYYNMDPVIGGAIDMHAEMPWSDAELIISDPGNDSTDILNTYEDMLNRTELLTWLPKITREFYVIGEVFPFAFWDDEDGIFSHIAVHNPDYVEVVDSPMIGVDALLTLRPSQELRRLMQSTDPRFMELRKHIPPDFLAALAAGRNMPLDPTNASHIARKAFPYDIRGVSILARLFRILMYEDAVFQGQIQQAQRHALPLRLFKIGDQQRGWMPSRQQQEEFIQMLAQAEVDPLAAIVYHYGISAEYLGMEGKQLKISVEWDVIERAKLIALGVNKAFIHGEVTYASANAGLQVLMMRYRALRDMILADWVYKKIFAKVAELNGFTRAVKKTDTDEPLPRDPMERQTRSLTDRLKKIAALSDPGEQEYELRVIQREIDAVNRNGLRRRVAMNRSGAAYRSEANPNKKLLYPKLQFDKRLDVRQEESILRLWIDLQKRGLISARSVVQGAGLEFDEEQGSITKDAAYIAKNKMVAQILEEGDKGGGGGGGGGLGAAIGIGESLDEGAEAAPGGDEAGEGAGAPGSGEAATRLRKMVRLGDLPLVVARDIDAIIADKDARPGLFVEAGREASIPKEILGG